MPERTRFTYVSREKARVSGLFRKPSDGLEPSTPSLPWRLRATGRASGGQERLEAGVGHQSRPARVSVEVDHWLTRLPHT